MGILISPPFPVNPGIRLKKSFGRFTATDAAPALMSPAAENSATTDSKRRPTIKSTNMLAGANAALAKQLM